VPQVFGLHAGTTKGGALGESAALGVLARKEGGCSLGYG
jgi:hypothetical protein